MRVHFCVVALSLMFASSAIAANKYWVGGSGTWNSVNSANWSTASGGSGGAVAPAAGDRVIFDANSGAGIITIDSNRSVHSFDTANFTGTFAAASPYIISVYGNPAEVTLNANASYSSNLTLKGVTTNATLNVTSNGAAIPKNGLSLMNSVGTRIYFFDDWSSSGTITASSGSSNSQALYSNGHDITCAKLTGAALGTSKEVNFNNTGTLTLTGTALPFYLPTGGLSWTPPALIKFAPTGATTTDLTAVNYVSSFPDVEIIPAAANSSFTFNNTASFRNFTVRTVHSGAAVKFRNSSFSGVFSVKGNPGQLITLGSYSGGTRVTLTSSSGNMDNDFVSIQDIGVGGGASWYAGANSVNVSNNLGWIWTPPPAPATNIFMGNFF